MFNAQMTCKELNMKPTTAQIAKLFGCTEQQVRDQFLANAAQLSLMANKSKRAGHKVNNFTAQQLSSHAAFAMAKATGKEI